MVAFYVLSDYVFGDLQLTWNLAKNLSPSCIQEWSKLLWGPFTRPKLMGNRHRRMSLKWEVAVRQPWILALWDLADSESLVVSRVLIHYTGYRILWLPRDSSHKAIVPKFTNKRNLKCGACPACGAYFLVTTIALRLWSRGSHNIR